MNRRERRAIIEYWLSKRWQGIDPLHLVQWLRRHPRVMSCLLVFSLFLSVPAARATEVSSDSGLIKKAVKALSGKEKAPAEKRLVSGPKVASPAKEEVDPRFKDAKKAMKKATGIFNNYYKGRLTLETAATEEGTEEIAFPVAKELKLKRFKKMAELKPGDKVEVTYQEWYRDGKSKEEAAEIIERRILEVTLIEKYVPLKTPQVTL